MVGVTGGSVDESVQLSFEGADDKAWKRERRRKRRKQIEPPPMPDGPCCGRCANWRPPGEHDDYGECRRLVVLTTGRADESRILGFDEALARGAVGLDYLHTQPWFRCSQYAEREAT